MKSAANSACGVQQGAQDLCAGLSVVGECGETVEGDVDLGCGESELGVQAQPYR
jgi:hypothetical protein